MRRVVASGITAALLLTSCSGDDRPTAAPSGVASTSTAPSRTATASPGTAQPYEWHQLPTMPLSPRWFPLAIWFWTGERIVSGLMSTGRRARRSRPGALDPATGTWSRLPWMPPGEEHLFYGGWPTTDGPLSFVDGYVYDDEEGSFTPVRTPDASYVGGGVVVADGVLMSFGGYYAEPDPEPERVTRVVPTDDVWAIRVR